MSNADAMIAEVLAANPKPGRGVYGNTPRQRAVVEVERTLSALIAAVREEERGRIAASVEQYANAPDQRFNYDEQMLLCSVASDIQDGDL